MNFNLKSKEHNKETSINLIFRFNSLRLKYGIGKQIDLQFWDNKKQRAKANPKFPFHVEFNMELSGWENEVNRIFKRYWLFRFNRKNSPIF